MATPLVDPRGARFGQGVTAALLLAALALQATWLVPVTGFVLALGVLLGPRRTPPSLLFAHAVRPLLRLGPPRVRRPAAPVRFAQGVGASFLLAATVSLLVVPAPVGAWLGWGLATAVAGLAALAAATDYCIGCEAYAVLHRLGLLRAAAILR